MKKRILSAILLLAMLISCAACATEQLPVDGTTTGTTETTTVPEETTAGRDKADLPEKYDLDGFDVRVLIMKNAAGAGAMAVIAPEESTAEVLNDAMYNRNVALETKYNYTMSNHEVDNVLRSLTTSVTAQLDEYDIALPYFNDAAMKIGDGLFADLNKIQNLDLTKNYWDQNFNESISVSDKLYFAVGDIMVSDDDVLLMIMYNSALGTDLGVENLYTAVNEGRWTYDMMQKYAQKAVSDVNGDGKMDDTDRYGYFWASNNCIYPHFAATGTQLFIKDKDNMPVLNPNVEKAHTVFDMMYELLDQERYSYNWMTFKDQKNGIITMISNKQVLFQNMILSQVRRLYRDIPVNFGLLPMPKLTENQDNYYSSAWKSFSTLCVPSTNTHQAETGFVLEAMASASDEINHAYYEVCLQSKYTRDRESYDMIKLARTNVLYDLSWIYDWGKMGSAINTAAAERNGQLASLLASYSELAQKEAAAFVEKLR